MTREQFVKRELYLDKLRKYKGNTDFIKVIEGVRRCGKSTLLKQFSDELVISGVDSADILMVEMESRDSEKFREKGVLSDYLYDAIPRDRRTYLFIDEIQHVPDWQLLIDGLMVDRKECDIYITGSNAFLLSGEIATYLTGRCVEIRMLPLSFSEFSELNGKEDVNRLFDKFLRYGSFPMVRANWDEQMLSDYLEGLYHTIVVKDIQLRAGSEISNVKLNRLVEYLMGSAGSDTSIQNIAHDLGLSYNTVDKYVGLLIDAFLIYPVKEYNLKGRRLLDNDLKYYPVDTGLRNSLVGFRSENIGRMLESVVYLELVRRGYTVSVGRDTGSEVDFVAVKAGKTEYYQVTYLLNSEKVINREFGNLRKVEDNYPKYVLSMDPITADTSDGLIHLNIVDWLLKE